MPSTSSNDDSGNIEAPLLAGHALVEQQEEQRPRNLWACTANLTKVILGAGVMAIPRALAIAGTVLGGVMLIFVGVLTWYTVMGLVHASKCHNSRTYGSLTNNALGWAAAKVLQLAVVLGCIGFCVVYYDILLDILVGNGPCQGILPEVLPRHWQESVWATRPVVLAAIMGVLILPNVMRHSMSHLGAVNAVGLLSLVGFAGTMVWLAVAATIKGNSHVLPIGPDLKLLGHGTLHQLVRAAGLVPIILTADSCHHAVHPVMSLLKPYSAQSMSFVVATAVGCATVLYGIVSVSAYITFGRSINENILNNLDVPSMAPLIGMRVAVTVAAGVRLGYIVSLLGNAILMMFPLRDACVELVTGKHSEDDKDHVVHHMTTVVLLASIYAISVFVPSIWDAIAIVGSFSSTTTCFIVPGAIIYVIQDRLMPWHCCRKVAVCVSLLGVALLMNGIATFVIGIKAKKAL